MRTMLLILLIIYSIHALLKPLFFLALSYDKRRAALDRSYRGRLSATRWSDRVLLGLCIMLAALLELNGAEHVSFLTGLLVGMTLIQLFFHRFSAPLPKQLDAPPPRSPIKIMSYAIQAQPGRSWKELLLICILVGWCLLQIAI